MKKVLMLALSLLTTQIPAKDISVGWELWYPYQYHNKQQQLVGLDFDIFNALIKEIGVNVNYTELPWKRHLQLIISGEIDIAMGASYTKEREQDAYFTVPYRTETVRLFVRHGTKDKIKLTSLNDIIDSEYTIGIENGYYYGDTFKLLRNNKYFMSHIKDVLDLEQNVDMALKGHLDGFLVDPFTLKAFTKKYGLENEFELHPLEIYQTDINIMISKKSGTPEMLQSFNQAINKLKANGTMATILKNWSDIEKQ